jgi:hypothetical protein
MAELDWPNDDIVGAEFVHHDLRGWLFTLGHQEYDEPAAKAAGPAS